MSKVVSQRQRKHRLCGQDVSNRRSTAQQHYPLPGQLPENSYSCVQRPHCQVPIIRLLMAHTDKG